MPSDQTGLTTRQSTAKTLLDSFIDDLTVDIIKSEQVLNSVSSQITELNRKISSLFARVDPSKAVSDVDLEKLIIDVRGAKAKITVLEGLISNNSERLRFLLDQISIVKVDSDIRFTGGIHKDERVCDVPASYLMYIYENGYANGQIYQYINKNYHLIKLKSERENK